MEQKVFQVMLACAKTGLFDQVSVPAFIKGTKAFINAVEEHPVEGSCFPPVGFKKVNFTWKHE